MKNLTITIMRQDKIHIHLLSESPTVIYKFLIGLENTLEQCIINLCRKLSEGDSYSEQARTCEEYRQELIISLIGINNNMKSVKSIIALHSKITDSVFSGDLSTLGIYEYTYKGGKFKIKYEYI